MEFIESSIFHRRRPKYMTDEELQDLITFLASHPDAEDPIPKGGGIRKLRWTNSQRGKGKRSGSRTIYLYLAAAETIHLMLIYDHEVANDLNPAERKKLAAWSKELKSLAKRKG